MNLASLKNNFLTILGCQLTTFQDYMDKLVNGSSDTANMGYYQKKLWQALNEMNEQQAEQVSKNVLGLLNINKK